MRYFHIRHDYHGGPGLVYWKENEMGQCNMRDDFRHMIFVLRDMRNDDIVIYLLLSLFGIPLSWTCRCRCLHCICMCLLGFLGFSYLGEESCTLSVDTVCLIIPS
jgi:hypothetical protein